jgi:ribonuclease HI
MTEADMSFSSMKKWLANHLELQKRQETICIWYLLFLMVSTRKHTLQEAARFSGFNKSQFSRLLKSHSGLAVYNLSQLSKRQARQFSSSIDLLKDGSLPWRIALLIDSTIQSRSSLHTDNVKRFNHGQGFVIGHQWTNILLLINDRIIPLTPIPFYSKRYCREKGLSYKTENEAIVQYIQDLKLEEYVGPHNPHEVVVLADSGYDDRKIQNAIAEKKWAYVIALKKNRGVRSDKTQATTPLSRGWCQVESFFKNHRRVKWETVRVPSSDPKKKRMEFRIRQINAYLRYVEQVQLICSEFKKRPKGRRKYLACNDLKATPRQILIAYRLRWKIEIFHKEVKMFLGFQEVAAKHFLSVLAHVHWVYCASILLHALPPPGHKNKNSVAQKQQYVMAIVDGKEKSRIVQVLTQFKGPERYKTELRMALKAL